MGVFNIINRFKYFSTKFRYFFIKFNKWLSVKIQRNKLDKYDTNIYFDCSTRNSIYVTLSGLPSNNLLMYSGSKWINSAMSLEMKNDIIVSSLTNKIYYDKIK